MRVSRGRRTVLTTVLSLFLLGTIAGVTGAFSSAVFTFRGLVGNGCVDSQSQYTNTNMNVTVQSHYYTRTGGYEPNRINVTLYMWTSGGYRYYSQQSVDAWGGGTVYWNAPPGWYYINVSLANPARYGSYASGTFWMWGR